MWQADPNFNVVLLVGLIFGIIGAVPVLIAVLASNNSQKKREAELIRLAIEKGQPLPSFPRAAKSHLSSIKAALIWAAVGLGVILMSVTEGMHQWQGVSFGMMFILIGLAVGIGGWIVGRQIARDEGRAN